MSFGIYIHFPFCRRRCGYCDFATAARQVIPHQAYAEAVVRELEVRSAAFAGRTLASIYFGGGTPSLWQPECVGRVVEEVRRRFPCRGEPEVTLEANPGELGDLRGLRAVGVNRLSLGVQSLDDGMLARLGRIHDAAQAKAAVEAARRAGFANLSLDLIYALPGQSSLGVEHDLAATLALAPDHLSIYCLTLERETPLGRALARGELKLPGGELEAEMFERIAARLRQAGFEHYEISNFARPGRRAVHNLLYWSGGEWLGLGAHAHSMRWLPPTKSRAAPAAERISTVPTDAYLAWAETDGEAGEPIVADRQILDENALAREAMWLGLRRISDGVDEEAFARRFGQSPRQRFARAVVRLLAAGLLEEWSGRLRLTWRGVLLADEVAQEFL